MKKIILLLYLAILGCKSNEIAMTTTGLVTDKTMVVSARQEASNWSSYHEKVVMHLMLW
jgi:gamma-glutamyltranspeptidase/glutathione hydrolase